jgi:hypothetical protein
LGTFARSFPKRKVRQGVLSFLGRNVPLTRNGKRFSDGKRTFGILSEWLPSLCGKSANLSRAAGIAFTVPKQNLTYTIGAKPFTLQGAFCILQIIRSMEK